MARAPIFVAFVFLALTAAGAASVETDNQSGRQLLTSGYWAWYPNQAQVQVGGNAAKNVGTANQQSNQQALQQQGSYNWGVNSNQQSINTGGAPPKDPPPKDDGHGRKLLTQGQWVWYPSQVQFQAGGNAAKNTGTANQQSNQQAVQQWGYGNSGGNDNSQSITTAPPKDPPPPKDNTWGRKLLTQGQWVWYPSQFQAQVGGNVAKNTGTANQQSNQQALQQSGWSNSGGNVNSQSINTGAPPKDPPPPKDDGHGRKLLTQGQWVWYPSQVQFQAGGNAAKNVGTANQQSNQQAVQQWGYGNSGGNSNSQSINTGPEPKDPPPKHP